MSPSSRNKRHGLAEAIDLSMSPEARVHAVINYLAKLPGYSSWDAYIMRQVKVISVTAGQAEFEMQVTEEMCNAVGNLHGGCSATILDMLTSVTLLTMAKPGFMDGGSVSRTFLCSLLGAVPQGTTIRIFCKVARGGRRMSNVQGEIRTLDGQVAVTLSHDKVERPRPKI